MMINNNYNSYNFAKANRANGTTQSTRAYLPALSFTAKDTFVKTNPQVSFTGWNSLKTNIEKKFELAKQEKIAKKLGVKAEFSCSTGLAKMVNETLQLLKDQGYLLPKVLYCGDKYLKNYEDPDALGVMDKQKGIMWMKSSMYIGSFRDTETEIDPFKFLVLHEVGHYNLYQSFKAKEGPGSYNKFYNDRLWDDPVIEELGLNATRNSDEFCADVFAKLAGGEKVSEPMMKIYKESAGKHI